MKDRMFSTGSMILVVSIFLTAVSAFVTWRLFPIPFGDLFEALLTLTVVSLVLTLAVLTVMVMRAGKVWLKAAAILPAALMVVIGSTGIILKTDYRLLPEMSFRYGLSAREWREDVRYFAEQFPEQHVRLYEMVPQEKFEARAAELERKVPELSETEIKNEIFKLVALPNDAHSFPNVFTHKLDWHAIPFKLWLFGDGVYVLDAGREHRGLIGARLVEIENTPVDAAYEILRPYISAESEYNWKDRFIHCLSIGEFLHGGGIVEDPRDFFMTFETRDRLETTVEVETYHYVPVIYWSSIRPVDNDLPYILPNDRRDNYWFEYREDTGTLYLQFNRCLRESGEETIEGFVERLGRWVEENEFERFVVDIRKNDGGDGYVSRKLADLIIGTAKIDRAGRLFVLTSRKTFSAAVMFLSRIDNNTKAILVGEPTGQGPFFCGGPRPVTLPNSGLELNVSRHYNRCSLIDDGSDCIEPDLFVDYTIEDFLNGRDPVMEKVLAYGNPVATTGEIDSMSIERYTGRYCFSPFQILTVEPAGEGLKFSVDDFFEGSYRNVSSRLYAAGGPLFHTDIFGVELLFSEGSGAAVDGVVLKWRGTDTYAGRSPEGHRKPMELFADGRIDEAAEALFSQREVYFAEVPDLEARLNLMGYTLLGERKDAEAVKVFELNVRLFPESANTYDSLGEGYMLSGDRELAIKNYEKALELDPDSGNARETLDRLRRGETWDRQERRWTD